MADSNDSKDQPDRPTSSDHYASASRWRHQESSRFHRHAKEGRDATASSSGDTAALASFLNSSRVEGNGQDGAGHIPIQIDGPSDRPGHDIACGPLLNYRRTVDNRWHGSVLIVVEGGGPEVQHQPTMHLRKAGEAPTARTDEAEAAGDDTTVVATGTVLQGERLYSDKRNTFWAFDIEVPIEAAETEYEYDFPDMRISSNDKPRTNSFFVPAATESMRLMFHSCNGFSVGTDEDAYSGAPLWNDVMRKHKRAPFHVMLGGGDQIYNDGIRVNGPLRPWTDIGNPKKRREFPFSEKLRAECDDYYLQNYIRWYNTAPFCYANGQIPQVNIWDDHDVGSNGRKRCHIALTMTRLLTDSVPTSTDS